MPLEITEAAKDVLERATAAALRLNPEASIRVFRAGDRIDTAFADSAQPGDDVLEVGDVKIFVEGGIDGILDVTEEHDRFLVR